MKRNNKIGIYLIVVLIMASFTTFINVKGITYKYVGLKLNMKAKISNSKGQAISTTVKPTSFKVYKVIIKASKLNIRKTPSSTAKLLGNYNLGNIVDVIGKSGKYVKTASGYIAEVYSQKLVGMYITVTTEAAIIRSSDSKVDDRVAIPGNHYKITGSKDNSLLIRVGRINGYIPQDAIKSISDNGKDKLTLGWDYLNKKSSNTTILSNPNEYVNVKSYKLGLAVLSPTWFGITGDPKVHSSINVSDIADLNYVKTAHKNGYLVWARLGETNKTRAGIQFSDKVVQARIIKQISDYAIKYDIDGINVDYEALGIDNKDGFTAFVKELYKDLKKMNLIVTVDVTKYTKSSSLYSLCYDRPKLAANCDYLILMGYDEHVSSSKEPGSVGSFGWVDASIKDILEQGVPSNKLILAVPFYLRDYSVISYDAVIFDKVGKIYNLPLISDSNKALDIKKGNVFKCLGTEGEWYIIEYNGSKGYILKNDGQFMASNIKNITTNSAITSGSAIIITTGAGINSVPEGAINLIIPYDVIIMKNDSVIYKSESEILINKIGDAQPKAYFKYISTQGDWYLIDYNGITGYVAKAQGTFVKADTRTINSASMSMNGALDSISQNNGSIYEDDIAQQKVGLYFKNDIEHYVWLETKESMQWRMNLINKYNLAGAAVWSLYWKPTEGIWDVIKNSMKSNI